VVLAAPTYLLSPLEKLVFLDICDAGIMGQVRDIDQLCLRVGVDPTDQAGRDPDKVAFALRNLVRKKLVVELAHPDAMRAIAQIPKHCLPPEDASAGQISECAILLGDAIECALAGVLR
jgi:hypothetical protein